MPLRDVTAAGNVTTDMVTTHRIAISKGRSKDPFIAAIRERGFTLRSLAKRIGCPHSLLSMYRSQTVPRPCPWPRAAQIEKLTGWPADLAHWPNGLA
jgi:hypothetical protein